jgi:transposase
MANADMPQEFFEAVAHHLPPEQPVGPKGGRPRIGHRAVVRVIWFVLTTGARWEDVPAELGCSGRTAHRRLGEWEEAGSGTACTPTCWGC